MAGEPLVDLGGEWLSCRRRDPHAPHTWHVPGADVCCPGVGYVLLRSAVVRDGGRTYPGCHDRPRIERRWFGRWSEGSAPDYDVEEARRLGDAGARSH